MAKQSADVLGAHTDLAVIGADDGWCGTALHGLRSDSAALVSADAVGMVLCGLYRNVGRQEQTVQLGSAFICGTISVVIRSSYEFLPMVPAKFDSQNRADNRGEELGSAVEHVQSA